MIEVIGAVLLLAMLPKTHHAERALERVLEISHETRREPYRFSVIFQMPLEFIRFMQKTRLNEGCDDPWCSDQEDQEYVAASLVHEFNFEELKGHLGHEFIGIYVDLVNSKQTVWAGIIVEVEFSPDEANNPPEVLAFEGRSVANVVTDRMEEVMPGEWAEGDSDADFWILGTQGAGLFESPLPTEEERTVWTSERLLGIPEPVGEQERIAQHSPRGRPAGEAASKAAYKMRWAKIVELNP